MKKILALAFLPVILTTSAYAHDTEHSAEKKTIATQNAALKNNTEGKGYGPQSPRDLTNKKGNNRRHFSSAPPYTKMNLCNIHFHKNAEHKGGEFTTYVGDGDGHGYQTGYKYSGKLSAAESTPLDAEICSSKHGGLQVGDTMELHYVHSTAPITPGPTLNSCLSKTIMNPQLRVEAQVFVLVNNPKAADFSELTKVGEVNGHPQALNIPQNTGKPIQYTGSTTGPAYNEKGSPLQVSWSVRPRVMKVNAASVGQWCKGNAFNEEQPHGVRNLVIDEDLLSHIK